MVRFVSKFNFMIPPSRVHLPDPNDLTALGFVEFRQN